MSNIETEHLSLLFQDEQSGSALLSAKIPRNDNETFDEGGYPTRETMLQLAIMRPPLESRANSPADQRKDRGIIDTLETRTSH